MNKIFDIAYINHSKRASSKKNDTFHVLDQYSRTVGTNKKYDAFIALSFVHEPTKIYI